LVLLIGWVDGCLLVVWLDGRKLFRWFNEWMVGLMIVGFVSFPFRVGGGYCLLGLNCLFV
jgi:hypothetical protein